MQVKLKDYTVRSVSSGTEALGEANVEVEHNDRTYHGKGVSTDIIEASALAYLNALNKVLSNADGKAIHPQHGV